MSAGTEKSLIPEIKKLGIVAGSGGIPKQLIDACKAQNIQTYVIGIKGQTDHVVPDSWGRIGTAGKMIRDFKSQNLSDLIFIGGVKRPTIFDLWPDWFTFKFFLKVWLNSFGDNSLLEAMRQELEFQNFRIHGVHKYLPELLMTKGCISHLHPSEKLKADIKIGIQDSQSLGLADIGQAVIVKDGTVIAREDKKGTSAMIMRHGVEGAILVKTCKPQQDKDLDLPTIGPNTVQLCADKKMAGIVGHAGYSLLVDKDLAVKIADENNLFLIGVTIDDAY